jgi:hypothetical protein
VIHKIINETVERCKENYKASDKHKWLLRIERKLTCPLQTGMQKRMIDDTARRMTQLLATIDEHGLANDILHSLCQLCQGMHVSYDNVLCG